MVKPFVALGRDMFVLAENVEDNTEELVQKTALKLHELLTMRTPVDTGFARLNWLFSLERPITNTVPLTGSVEIQTGIQVVFQYELDDTLWLVNNVPYIHALNRGHSKQAPPYFIEQTVREVADIDKRISLTKRGT